MRITAAGFRAVRIRIDSQMIRYPSLKEFVSGYLSATPVAQVVATLDELFTDGMEITSQAQAAAA
jgi:hypothetical protein